MNKLVRYNLVRGLPTKCFENDHNCTACLKGKQHKASCKSKLVTSVTKPLHILHMDIFGPTSVSSISHKWYCLVVTDDFSRFTWTFFLKTKDEMSGILRKFITEIKNLKDLKVKIIRCDNGGEFRNKELNDFCSQKGIKREFSNARTPQQNGVAEKRNRSLIEAARTMVLVNKAYNKTPYELFNGRTPAIGFLKPFGCHVMILNTLDNLDDQLETLTVETSIPTASSPVLTVCFTDSQKPLSETRLISKRVTNQAKTPSLDNILTLTNQFEDILRDTSNLEESNEVEADVSNMEITITASPTPTLRIHRDHPKNPSWVEAMQEELFQFKIQKVWSLVDCPKGVRPIGTKWVLKNKKDERGIFIRNKAKLVAQGHTQEERIDYDEVFAPVVRIEAIRLFLAYASFMGFTVYQMDVKSAFLYGTIDEEVYVMQPPGFQDPEYPARVYKVEKAMYGLHQAPRAWIFRYLNGHLKMGLWYPKDSPFDLVAYSDSDYGGATQDRKSTSGGCQFLGRRLISWQCKKQTIIATSATETEYVAAASCCRQVLWIQNQLLDYGLSMPCETLSKEISTSILRLLHTAKTLDLVWIWLGGDYGNGIPTGSDEFPLPKQLPTANEDKFPLLIQSDATVEELCAAAEVKE
nr:retrovirus-related Pol polyprotein from transposon TNT 1-94 [Tanacetum cinerariifolium]